MRFSQWATTFNISVQPSESRPDTQEGDVVYRVHDIFTTRDGSWEPSSAYGSLPQWARDSYLRPWGAPDYFDDAGGDHHLFARVLDLDGNPLKERDLICYWSDGFARLGDAGYQGYVHMTPKEGSGWANNVIFNSYDPEGGGVGAWCWCPVGAADVVVGGGMPHNHHISTFAVWQAQPRSDGNGPTPAEPDGPGVSAAAVDENIRQSLWQQAAPTANHNSAIAAYARQHRLGAPITTMHTVAGYLTQGYANGIVLAPADHPENMRHIAW